MRRLLLILMLLIPATCFGATYYVSNTGSDSANGTSRATPWQTINKVNTSSFSADDSVLFKSGGVWREQLVVPSSGTSGHPITFSAYSTGAKPIINGEPSGTFTATAETGNTAEWTTITKAGTSDFTATTLSRFFGRYGFRAITDGTNWVYASKTITAQSDVHLRFYFYLDPNFAETADYKYTEIVSLYSGATRKIRAYVQQYPSNQFQAHVQLYFGSYTNYGNTGYFTRGGWHRLDIHYKADASVGGFQAWFDGVSLGSKFDENTTGDIDSIRLGMMDQDNPSASSIIYFDNIKISASALVAVDTAVDLNNKDYVTLSNLAVADAGDIGILLRGGSDNNTIDGVTVYHIGSSVGYKSGILLMGANNNTVTNSTVYDVFQGIVVSGYGNVVSHNNTVSNNHVYDLNDSGVVSGPAGGTVTNGTKVYNNHIEYCALTIDDRPGIMLYGAGTGMEAKYNHVHHCGTSVARGEGIEADTDADGVVIAYNIFHDSTNSGIGLTGANHLVYNNVCYNNNTTGYDAGEINIWGNGATMTIKNNISVASTGKSLLIAGTGNTTGHVIDYNDWYGGSATPFTWGATAYNFADYKTAATQDSHSIASDPLFVSATDFHIPNTSPCKNAGVDVGLTSDYVGNPIVGLPDMGVYEIAAASCGADHNGLFSVAPRLRLCTSGTASTVTQGETWTWTCTGGSVANCTANIYQGCSRGGGGF